jgi:NADH/NAD ratio-sensing transcriptional regulator Rex
MINQNRRKFLKLSTYAAALLGLPFKDAYHFDEVESNIDRLLSPRKRINKSVIGLKTEPIQNVRVGIIGMGNRGYGHMKQLVALKHKSTIVGISDIQENKIEAALAYLKEQSIKTSAYQKDINDWKNLVKREDVDLVIIATPWSDHVTMAVEAMRNGKQVAMEVPAALTLEDTWKLVDTAEEMQVNCMMMENVCYGDEELWILNMVKEGVFGTLTHAEAAYIHDLRALMFSKTYYQNQWRVRHHIKDDGNLYPTHGLGPVAQYMDIGRGDRFSKIVSMSSLQAGLSEYSQTLDPDNEFYKREQYVHGDMSSSLIKTKKGRSILVQHDVVTPRPYNRINALGGTKAYHEGYPSRLSMNDFHNGHRWLEKEAYDEMRTKYKHPIWNELKDEIERNGGHGGMDFVQMYRLIDCLNKGKVLDMDVYDAADWSVVTPLSKLSVELGSMPIDFPDFTRGEWVKERTLGIMIK